ncbi:MAG: DNA adenine methylase [Microcystaceae cyanobacterium]
MKTNKSLVKSPLRYPGGKSRAIKTIEQYLPHHFSEYREPFIGGGSVFIYLKQKFPKLQCWINDLNPELFYFWQETQQNIDKLISEISYIKKNYPDGRKLFAELTQVNVEELSSLERGVRFFVLNRITFSGTVESGGFSIQAFDKRFTDSSIDRLGKLAPLLEDVKITNLDYSQVLSQKGNDVFIFLDPPYYSANKSRLYGKDGKLHTTFDHQRFSDLTQDCSHQWLITYDDSPVIRDYFQDCYLHEWELQYGMNNYKQGKANKGKELIITNYSAENNKPVIPVTTHQLTLDLM